MPGTPIEDKVYDCILHLPYINLSRWDDFSHPIWENKTGKRLKIIDIKFEHIKRPKVEFINASNT
jgi:hypothetical protein